MKYLSIPIVMLFLVTCMNNDIESTDVVVTIASTNPSFNMSNPTNLIVKVSNETDTAITIYAGTSCLLSAEIEITDNLHPIIDGQGCYQSQRSLVLGPNESYQEELPWYGEYVIAQNTRDTLSAGIYNIIGFATTLEGERISSSRILISYE